MPILCHKTVFQCSEMEHMSFVDDSAWNTIRGEADTVRGGVRREHRYDVVLDNAKESVKQVVVLS